MKKSRGGRRGHQGLDATAPGALTEDGDVLRIPTKGSDVLAHPLQRENEVTQVQVALNDVPVVG
ncbi:Uncharacterised protein [Mycobacteroides abscessus subsp. abscessus]|nr:Uncharacterised protein [Mycobacteroides abscessus subsp. abscessus]SHV87906.1 Uncharacterised protein [Mycobacteroides abscessus subsp. abscessus]